MSYAILSKELTKRQQAVKVYTRGMDDDFFEQIFRRYYDRIYKYFYFKCKNPTDAEDYTQQVFSNFYTSGFDKSVGDANLPLVYIYKIASNIIKTHYRKTVLLNTIKNFLRMNFRVDCSDCPVGLEGDLCKILDSEDVWLVEMRFFMDMKIKDIASQMKLNENTVKSRLKRVLVKLKKEYLT